MIVKEFYRERRDGVKLYKTYSDEGLLIRKEGTDEEYDAAIDTESSSFEYVEVSKTKNADTFSDVT